MSSSEDEHYLTSYLSTALPRLGLDPDTYGPYVTGLFPIDPDEYYDDVDEDEMTDILGLLQSSSETHAINDDNSNTQVWNEFQDDIIKRRDLFLKAEMKKKELQMAKNNEDIQRKLQLAREEAKQQELQLAYEKERGKQVNKEKDERLAALIDQYGYENNDVLDNDINNGHKKNGEDDFKTNREVAAETAKSINEKARAESNKSIQSKKTAREITNMQKRDKMRQKEERRKRATKGERRG